MVSWLVFLFLGTVQLIAAQYAGAPPGMENMSPAAGQQLANCSQQFAACFSGVSKVAGIGGTGPPPGGASGPPPEGAQPEPPAGGGAMGMNMSRAIFCRDDNKVTIELDKADVCYKNVLKNCFTLKEAREVFDNMMKMQPMGDISALIQIYKGVCKKGCEDIEKRIETMQACGSLPMVSPNSKLPETATDEEKKAKCDELQKNIDCASKKADNCEATVLFVRTLIVKTAATVSPANCTLVEPLMDYPRETSAGYSKESMTFVMLTVLLSTLYFF